MVTQFLPTITMHRLMGYALPSRDFFRNRLDATQTPPNGEAQLSGLDEPASALQRPLYATLPVFPILSWSVLCAASCLNLLDISVGGEESSVGLDVQAFVKLLVAAAAGGIGVWGLINSVAVRGALIGLPGSLIVLLASVLLATSAFAIPEGASVSRAAAVILVAYLLFVPTAYVTLGFRGVLTALLIGMAVNVVLNWIVYFAVPSVGVFQEELSGQVFYFRMGGLGHPNSIGRLAAVSALIAFAMLRDPSLILRFRGIRIVLVCLIVLMAGTMVLTFSRTAALAGVLAIGALMFDRLWSRPGIAVIVAGVGALTLGLFAVELITDGKLLHSLALSATKSGEVEELTTATGRTAIWAEAVRLIQERPWTGWGLNSAPLIMEDFSSHTHNLLLHAALCGGVFAGLLVAALLLWNLCVGLRAAEPIVRGVSVFVLVSGIFEDTCLEAFASPATILWLLVLLYPALEARRRSPIENEPEPSYNGLTG